jgi:hypothetical protein
MFSPTSPVRKRGRACYSFRRFAPQSTLLSIPSASCGPLERSRASWRWTRATTGPYFVRDHVAASGRIHAHWKLQLSPINGLRYADQHSCLHCTSLRADPGLGEDGSRTGSGGRLSPNLTAVIEDGLTGQASLSPQPLSVPVVTNGSNNRSRIESGIPGPVSSRPTSTRSSAILPLMRISPPWDSPSTGFETRLMNTRCIRERCSGSTIPGIYRARAELNVDLFPWITLVRSVSSS